MSVRPPKMEKMGVIRVLVVDDHRAFAGAVATMLSAQPDMDCVGISDCAAAARAEVKRLQPDVAVVDVDLAGEDGIAVAAPLRVLPIAPAPTSTLDGIAAPDRASASDPP